MIKQKIQQLIKDAAGIEADVVKPKSDFGDYAVFIKNLETLNLKLETLKLPEIERVEIKGNYINFFLSKEFLQSELTRMQNDTWYMIRDTWSGKTVMVEYTDPNPFKKFHIGHMMSNTIGEAIAQLYEVSGAKVLRVNYQGDVGMHVAKAVWADGDYAKGSKAYDEDNEAKKEIEEINRKIYTKSDEEINKKYQKGRTENLEYF